MQAWMGERGKVAEFELVGPAITSSQGRRAPICTSCYDWGREAAMTEVSTTEARDTFAELVGRVAYGKERVVITRNGKRQAVVVPVEDLDRLEALERERGLSALRRLQDTAVSRGLDKLTPKAIDAEIQAVRAERRRKRKP